MPSLLPKKLITGAISAHNAKPSQVINIYFQPASIRNGRSRCYRCMAWVEDLVGQVLWTKPGQISIVFGLCCFCVALRERLSYPEQVKFAEKCEENLAATFDLQTLEVKV